MRVIDLSTLSLVGGSGIAEVKVPLWWANGTYASTTSTSQVYLQDGSTSYGTSGTNIELFTLSSNWSQNLQFALESTIWTSNSTSGITGVWIYDFTYSSNSPMVTTSSSTAITIRGSKFNLVPGHTYGVAFYTNNSSYTAYVSDASLIIFPI